MIIKKTNTASIVLKTLLTIIILYVLLIVFGGFPIPRGRRVNSDYYTYYRNFLGIYYISVKDAPVLFNHGRWRYLDDVDEKSFKVLSEGWAKDVNHVWYRDKIIKNVDVKSFHINEHGVAVDKNKVYIRNRQNIIPSYSGIDVKTAEFYGR